MRYEDLKTHIAEVERCQKHTQTKSVPPVLFLRTISEKMKPCNSNLEDRYRGSTTNNIDILTLDVCPFPTSSSVSPWSPTTSYFRNSPGFPDSPRPYPQEISFKGTWRLTEMAKWFLAGPTTDTATAWDELISSCRITLFSGIPWNSNTWLSIAGITCLNR